MKMKVENDCNEISVYINDKNGNHIGYLLGKINPNVSNEYFITFSLCNKKDVFTKKIAKKIANEKFDYIVNRPSIVHVIIPNSIYSTFLKFQRRCEKYFKNKIRYISYINSNEII